MTLADAGVPPQAEIDFWAGPPRTEGEPLGQATRHGYITIAVEWLRPKQTAYDYSAREHHAVLGSLRDACRRFSIDTDRVFLTGHGIGGDAAWDVALAHPDIWAGVMPFVATADKYCLRYGDNADYVPWYFVCGELDGDKMSRNSRELDRYFGRNTDNTVVEYLGRGYEPFGDEMQRLFDWMGRRSRKMPEGVSMRDDAAVGQFLLVAGGPRSAGEIDGRTRQLAAAAGRPAVPRPRQTRPEQQGLGVHASGRDHRLARPEFVDFKKPINVELKGRRMTPARTEIKPNLSVLLEDARTRAERQHPFWAKVDSNDQKQRGDFADR